MAAGGIAELLRCNSRLRWFGTGLLVSRIGDVFNGIALAWLALSIGSPRSLGLVLLCAGLPRVPISPLAGYLLDRLDARTLLILDNCARAFVVAVVPVLGWLHVIEVWQLCLIAALTGILSTLTDVGENLVIPAIVREEEMESANAVVSVTYEASTLAGPAAAGVLVELMGYEAAFLCDAVSFLVMAIAATRLPSLRTQPGAGTTARSPIRRLTDGFALVARLRVVLMMTVVSLAFLVLSGMTEVIWPAYSKYVLHTRSGGYGVLMTVAGLGATLGVLALAGRLSRYGPGRSVGLVLFLHGALFVPLAVSHALPAVLVWTFLVYFVGMSFYTLERTIMQRAVPAEVRGQVFGARRAVTAMGYPLGGALAGQLVARFGTAPGFVVVGLGMCVMASFVWFVPTLRNDTAGPEAPAPQPPDPAVDSGIADRVGGMP